MPSQGKIFRSLDNIYSTCITWMSRLSGVFLVLILLLLVAHIIGRYFFKLPILCAIEFSEYFLSIIVFLAAPWVFVKDDNIKIDVIFPYLSYRNQTLLNCATSWVMAFFFLLLTYVGGFVTYDHFVRGLLSWKTVVVPLWLLDIVIPIACFFLFIGSIKRAQTYWRLRKERMDNC